MSEIRYFDLAVPVLTPMDNWLRHREVSGTRGSWQHRRGGSVACIRVVQYYDEVEGGRSYSASS
jgi:hypothetical protein